MTLRLQFVFILFGLNDSTILACFSFQHITELYFNIECNQY
jgi:hypothetical protein